MRFKDSSITLTVEKAKYFLTTNTYAGQRPLSPKHVKYLVGKITSGKFHVGSVAVVHYSDKTYLMDGQHQCHAVIEAGKSVKAKLVEYDIDDKSEIATVFAQFNADRIRSAPEVAWAAAVLIGMEDWSRRFVQTCATATMIVSSGGGRFDSSRGLTKEERAKLLEKNRADCFAAKDILCNGHGTVLDKHLSKGVVVAAVMATARKSKDDAAKFWKQVRDGEMLTKNSPAYKLRKYLMGIETIRGDSGREMYSKCITAWNAFRDNGSTDLKYYSEKPVPSPK